MDKGTSRTLINAALFLIVVLVGAFNVLNLKEAYGDGPPYYSRTTNMDKWIDPLPVLAAVDAITVFAVAAILYRTNRKR
ncbi:hypothetical protein [Caballeronia ptereochthonis]|uniref:Uncharacterized protein n=1 Tax=Caballeronia ptereochthonis TaxID=1777144 RepID=A0A158ABJ2_9BURK|nr:hypothetical protein [Caballeronia ptereochthonis]SAK55198.1 hypothetical protein AWB83_01617 [Caballeronia ptereochthonis]